MTSKNLFMVCVQSAVRVLGHSLAKIPDMFTDCDVCVMDYFNKGLEHKVIEVRFDMATLTCLFDEKERCDSAFLFLDAPADLTDYTAYCNAMYVYDYLLCGWRVGESCMRLKPSEVGPVFIFVPAELSGSESEKDN